MWPTLFLKKFIRMELHPNYSLNVVSTSIFWKINGHSYKIAFVGKNTFSTVDKYFSLCCSHICSFFFFRFTHSYFQNLHLHDTFLLHIFTIKKGSKRNQTDFFNETEDRKTLHLRPFSTAFDTKVSYTVHSPA